MNLFKAWLPEWAWQLLFRHLRGGRSRPAVKMMNAFAFFALLIGVFAWTSVLSIMQGLQNDRKDRILKEKPHLLWEASPSDGIAEKETLIREMLGDQLLRIKMLLQTEGLLEVPGQKQSGRITGSGVIIQGVDALDAELLVGAELMNILTLGDKELVKLHNVWKPDAPALEKRVSGSFETGIYEIDRGAIRIKRADLEHWLGLNNAISRIEIQLKDPYAAPSYLAVLESKTGLKFKSWQETEATLWYSLKLELFVLGLSMFFVVLIASFAVHLALSVRVAEKTREIGLLRGLGAPDIYLSRIYLSEGALIGFCGSFAGLFLGYFVCAGLSKYWSLPDIYYYASFPVDWNWGMNIFLALLASGLAIIASWWPAARVKTIEVQEALRS